MFKSYKYNHKRVGKKCKSAYRKEQELVHEFLATENENICFEYENDRQAKNARQAVAKYISTTKSPIKVHLRENLLFVVRDM